MRISQAKFTLLVALATGLLAGCAQSGVTLPRRTSMGALKSSLSHIEAENQQLRREVAQLKTDYREVEDRLVQEESYNGELKATLDDARHLLSQRGFDFDGTPGSTLTSERAQANSEITIPARQSGPRRPRKAPFAQIPGGIHAIPRTEPTLEEPAFDEDPPSAFRPGDQSRFSSPRPWLPIARGTTGPSSTK